MAREPSLSLGAQEPSLQQACYPDLPKCWSGTSPVVPTPRLSQGLIEVAQKREQAVYRHQALKED